MNSNGLSVGEGLAIVFALVASIALFLTAIALSSHQRHVAGYCCTVASIELFLILWYLWLALALRDEPMRRVA